MDSILNNATLVDLSTYGLIKVSGPEAADFLQGQLLCDINAVSIQSQLSGYCNAQGRLISIFRICRIENDFYLRMPKEIIDNTLSKLKKYALFAKVAISDISADWLLFGLAGPEASAIENTYVTALPGPVPRFEIMGESSQLAPILEKLQQNFPTQPSDYWRWLDILAGIPTIYHNTQEVFVPHRLNLQLLGAISFDKGCYIGQEIIARMHYKSTLKHHMYLVQLNTALSVNPDTTLTDKNGAEIGKIIDCYSADGKIYDALAVLLIEHAQSKEVFIEQTAISITINNT